MLVNLSSVSFDAAVNSWQLAIESCTRENEQLASLLLTVIILNESYRDVKNCMTEPTAGPPRSVFAGQTGDTSSQSPGGRGASRRLKFHSASTSANHPGSSGADSAQLTSRRVTNPLFSSTADRSFQVGQVWVKIARAS